MSNFDKRTDVRGLQIAGMELSKNFKPYPKASRVLFDLDGTLSLMRGGWGDVMLGLFMERISPFPGESRADLENLLREDMLKESGKPVISQFVRFVGRQQERCCKGDSPERMYQEFIHRMGKISDQRRQDMLSGKRSKESILVPGVDRMLHELRQRGLILYLASGSNIELVKREIEELGVADFFEERVYGDSPGFSKHSVIEKILSEPGVSSENLIAFGDGFVEISETTRVGGLAVAVASDESLVNLAVSGKTYPPQKEIIYPKKRNLLLRAGATVVMGDYRNAAERAAVLLGEKRI